MATQGANRAALMSIRPPYVSAILDGSKLIEFRKQRLACDINRVIIYTTSPVKAVVGEFQIAEQVIGTPAALWKQFSKIAGIERRPFFDYFGDCAEAVGILIKSATRYDKLYSLEEFGLHSRPPQSFKYIMKASEEISL